MKPFDDAEDPELGAACNRLAAWVEPLPAGAVIDGTGGLTETDLALILRHLHATRLGEAHAVAETARAPRMAGRSSVPITVRD